MAAAAKGSRLRVEHGILPGERTHFPINEFDDTLLLVIFGRLRRVKDIGIAACVYKRWWGLLKRAARVLADLQPYLEKHRLPGLHVSWPTGHQNNDFLLHLISLLPSLPLPSLYLHFLMIHGCPLRAVTPLCSVPVLDWSPACLTSLRSLNVASTVLPFDSLRNVLLLTQLTGLYLMEVSEQVRTSSRHSRPINAVPSLFTDLHRLTNLQRLACDMMHPVTSATFLETFTSSIGHLHGLRHLSLMSSTLCPAGMHTWTSLTNLKSLNLNGTKYRWPSVVTTELSCLKRLTALTRLVIRADEETHIGNVSWGLSCLTRLCTLGVNVYSDQQLADVAAASSLHSLSISVNAGDLDIGAMSRLLQLTSFSLECERSMYSVELLQEVVAAMPWLKGLTMNLAVEEEEEATVAVVLSELQGLESLTVINPRVPSVLRPLRQVASLRSLQLYCTLTEQHCREISRIHSLESLYVMIGGATAAGLKWLRHMPNLKRVGFLTEPLAAGGIDVLPKEMREREEEEDDEVDTECSDQE